MGLFDVHAHLTHGKLAGALPEVLRRAREAGVTSIVSNGLNPSDNAATVALAAREPMVRAAVGFYPVDTVLERMLADGVQYPRDAPPCSAEEGIADVRARAGDAFAVGEIGLDGHWVPERYWPEQERIFCELVEIAMAADRAIIIHTRKRERRALELLQELGAERVDWHCFGGKVKLARRIADAGYYLSIPANARRSESFTRMLQTLPRDRVLLETDCPYLAPTPGETNEPAHVAGTLAYAAEQWGETPEATLVQMEANFSRLFRADP